MDIRDLHSSTIGAVGIAAAAITTNTTTNGAIIDLQNANGVEFYIAVAARANGTFTPTIQLSNDAAMAGAVTATDALGLRGAFTAQSVDGIAQIGLGRTTYRYARLSIVSTVTSGAGAIVSATAVLHDLRVQPVV